MREERTASATNWLEPVERGMGMFGLFKISFDYYTWKDLVCVSDSSEKLEQRYYTKEKESHYPLYSEEKSKEIRKGRTEEFHYTISEVEVI